MGKESLNRNEEVQVDGHMAEELHRQALEVLEHYTVLDFCLTKKMTRATKNVENIIRTKHLCQQIFLTVHFVHRNCKKLK